MGSMTLQQIQQLASRGQLNQAERACRELLRAMPNNMQAVRLLGQITRQNGKAEESCRIFAQLRQIRPADFQLLGELGASLTAANKHAQARPLLEKAVQTMPSASLWHLWLGKCYLKLFKTTQAIRTLEKAREIDPDNEEILFHLSNALLTSGRPSHAEPLVQSYLEKHPQSIQGRMTLGNIYEHEARHDEAVQIYQTILAEEPGNDAAIGGVARCLRIEGNYDEALKILEPILGREPSYSQVLAILPIYIATKRYEASIEMLEKVLKHNNIPDPVRATIHFALGDCYEGLKAYDAAFRCYKKGNGYYPKSFVREHRLQLYQEIRQSATPELLAHGPKATIDASRCVFIVGMPRSGTSLIEQVLDAHPDIYGAGELTELPGAISMIADRMKKPVPAYLKDVDVQLLNEAGQQYVERVTALAPDAKLIVDKLPHNFEMLGMIERMLPGAKVLHCSRNPIDNCVSLFVTQLSAWHSYSNDLSNLGWAYGQYVELMAYWKSVLSLPILDLVYEDTVADLEQQARKVIDFLGVDWNENCLKFYQVKRSVSTASVDQVRQPIYTKSVARWKRYGQQINPLIESLKAAGVDVGDVGDLSAQRR